MQHGKLVNFQGTTWCFSDYNNDLLAMLGDEAQKGVTVASRALLVCHCTVAHLVLTVKRRSTLPTEFSQFVGHGS